MNKTKTCIKCGKTKKLSEFHKNSKSSDGKRSNCKQCQIASLHTEGSKNARKRQDHNRKCDKMYLASKCARKALTRMLGGDSKTVSVTKTRFDAPENADIKSLFGDLKKGDAIDHIVPVKAFKDNLQDHQLSDPFYQGALNYYKNLRVIKAKENLSKGGRYELDGFIKLLRDYSKETGKEPVDKTIKTPNGKEYVIV